MPVSDHIPPKSYQTDISSEPRERDMIGYSNILYGRPMFLRLLMPDSSESNVHMAVPVTIRHIVLNG